MIQLGVSQQAGASHHPVTKATRPTVGESIHRRAALARSLTQAAIPRWPHLRHVRAAHFYAGVAVPSVVFLCCWW